MKLLMVAMVKPSWALHAGGILAGVLTRRYDQGRAALEAETAGGRGGLRLEGWLPLGRAEGLAAVGGVCVGPAVPVGSHDAGVLRAAASGPGAAGLSLPLGRP